jgi:hypothetical protein
VWCVVYLARHGPCTSLYLDGNVCVCVCVCLHAHVMRKGLVTLVRCAGGREGGRKNEKKGGGGVLPMLPTLCTDNGVMNTMPDQYVTSQAKLNPKP